MYKANCNKNDNFEANEGEKTNIKLIVVAGKIESSHESSYFPCLKFAVPLIIRAQFLKRIKAKTLRYNFQTNFSTYCVLLPCRRFQTIQFMNTSLLKLSEAK